MTIVTVFFFFFSLFLLQVLNLPTSFEKKNPDRERTNQSTGTCLSLVLPYCHVTILRKVGKKNIWLLLPKSRSYDLFISSSSWVVFFSFLLVIVTRGKTGNSPNVPNKGSNLWTSDCEFECVWRWWLREIQKQPKSLKERVEPRTFHLLVRLCFGMVNPGNDNSDADDDDAVDDDDDNDYDDVMILWLTMVVIGFSILN